MTKWLATGSTFLGIIFLLAWSLLGIFGAIDSGATYFVALVAIAAAWTALGLLSAIHVAGGRRAA